MIRWFFGLLALIFAAQVSLRAEVLPVKASVLENDVLYLHVGGVGADLTTAISAAADGLVVSNKIVGTVLDLRFTDGTDADAAKVAADWLANRKSPLAILVNSETSGAAQKLALDLHTAQTGLIFGSATAGLLPDIAVEVKPSDELVFLKNPYAILATNTAVAIGTNAWVPFIDHTSEADLVRQKIKDGDEDEETASRPLPVVPTLRDPALARAVDFLKALAVLPTPRG